MNYHLLLKNNGDVEFDKTFETLEKVKQYLIENNKDLFDWQLEKHFYGGRWHQDFAELPNFTKCETVDDFNDIFKERDYSWWTMELEEI